MAVDSPEVASPISALADLDAVEALAAMRAGEIRCEDYGRALLERASALRHLNAFRTLHPDRVLEDARAADRARAAGEPLGRLHGLPLPVKDSVNTRDLPTSNGTLALRDFQPAADADVLRLLRAAGAIVMGKTNIHELSRGWTSNNGAFGAVRNPYDPDRIPGGSSGGSAAAVAARMAPLAIGEDTLGSIRVPASLCGVVGFRPTFGRYPGGGIMPLTLDKFDQAGPLARCVGDVMLFDEVVTGEARLAPRVLAGARIGVADYLVSGLEGEVRRIFSERLAQLEAEGVVVVRADIPGPAKDAYNVAREVIGFENVASISAFLRENGLAITFDELLASASPNVREIYRTPFTAGAHARAVRDLETIRAAVLRHFEAHALDALVFPPVLAPALPLGDNPEVVIEGARFPLRHVMGRNTALASCARLASLTLPAGLTRGGLPVGIEWVATPGRDRELLALGLAVERLWGRMPPPNIAPGAPE